jgi:hypothetical protein
MTEVASLVSLLSATSNIIQSAEIAVAEALTNRHYLMVLFQLRGYTVL